MEIFRKVTQLLVVATMLLTLCVSGAQAALKAYGPLDPVTTLPKWYQDNSNLALQLCLDQNGMCLLPPPFDTGAPITTTPGSISDANFPDESFYYSADALLNIEPSAELAKLSFVLEAAFLAGVFPDTGIVFLRTDLQKMSNLTPNSTYRATHPYGTFEFTTDGAGNTTGGGGVAIRLEDPAGGAAQWMPPMMKSGQFTGIGPFLRATTGFITKETSPGSGIFHTYIGDPAVGVTVNNGPNGNVFMIERILTNDVPVTGVSWSTNQWFLAGRVFTDPIASDLTFKATYARTAVDGQIDVFATSIPGALLTLGGTGLTPANLVVANPATGKQFLHVPLADSTLPTGITLTNSLDLQGMPPHPVTLVDEVKITQATYNPATSSVTVRAFSRDRIAAPAPTLTAIDFAAPRNVLDGTGTLVKNISGTIPPETITVTSSLGGAQTVPLSVVVSSLPVAGNDSVSVQNNGGNSLAINVLENDSASAPATLVASSVQVVTPPAHGTITINPANGVATYTIDPAFLGAGSDSFTYTVTDSNGLTSQPATVSVSITYVVVPAVLASPVPGSLLTSVSQLFTWNNTLATAYQLHVGTAGPGSTNIGFFPNPASTATSTTVSGLPTNGGTVYVRLYSLINGVWSFNDYTYTAIARATMLPSVPAVFTSSSQAFTWTNSGASLYQLHIGTGGAGSTDIGYFPNPASTATTVTVNNLPTNGTPVNVRLYSLVDGVWLFNDYTYTAYTAPVAATMLPSVPATISGGVQDFAWTNTGAALYQLHIGTTGAGSVDVGHFPNPASSATSVTVSGLPTSGTVNVRLYSLINGIWQFNDYVYSAIP